MATLASSGVGSGLDVETLVAKLVSAERTPADTRLGTAKTKLTTQLSAVGTFKSALSALNDKLAALKSGGSVGQYAATSSSTDNFTATTTSGAVAGSYDVEVVALAQAHKLTSAAYVGGATTALGAGDVTIGVGDESFTVSLSPTANTLADLRDAINNADDNPGVVATLVNESGGTRLLLTSADPGLDHALNVSSSLIGFTEKQPAADAHVRIDGFDVYASSNQIDKAIDGVTINLLKANAGTTYTLGVALDSKAATSAVQAFVTAYNSAISTMNALSKYDSTTKSSAALNGDNMVRGAMQQLRSIVSGSVSGAGSFKHLTDLGITTQADGTLKLDSTQLATALSTDKNSVQKLFSSENGYATQLAAALDRVIGDDGQIENRNDAIQRQLKDISNQQDALDLRMTKVETRYRAQYTALDTLMAQMQTTSSYLTQQLAALTSS